MRAVVQRVSEAAVSVDGEVRGPIAAGIVVLLGVASGDVPETADRLAGKVARLRVFENEEGRFDRSLLDTGGAALVVSQFTLIADSARRGTDRALPTPPDPNGRRRSTSGSAGRSATSACRSRRASSARGCRWRS